MLDFIEGNNYGGGGKETEDLERQIARAAHGAEDVIESHIISWIKFMPEPVKSTFDLQQRIQEMDGMMEKVAEVKEKHGIERGATHTFKTC